MCDEHFWQTKSPDNLSWHQWNEAFFIFDEQSGQTHFLNELAAYSVRFLSGTVTSAEALYRAILSQYAIEEDPALLKAIQTTLGRLDELGLVTKSSST